MANLVSFALDNGGEVVVEVDPGAPVGMSPAGPARDVVLSAAHSFEHAIGKVRDAASAALSQFGSMAHRPDEIEIKFGVKLDAQAGAVIAKTGLQGQLEVKLKWVKPEEVPSSDGAGTASGVSPAVSGP